MTGPLRLVDALSVQDLATFLHRARRLDPDGATRLSGGGGVLAVYVSPLHGGGGPDVLGLRTFALREPCDVDVVVPLAALTDRLARLAPALREAAPPQVPPPPDLPVPPVTAAGVSWAGVSPPRSGWAPAGHVDTEALMAAARDGIAEVAAGLPDVAGAPAVARLRAQVWGRPLPAGAGTAPRGPAGFAGEAGFDAPDAAAGVPAGAAFAADALGFLDAGPVPAFVAGPWHRLSTRRGHVLVRRPLLS